MSRHTLSYIPNTASNLTPFSSAQEAWFWFICSRLAQEEGAGYSRGEARVLRPCEPMDIFKVVERLYRKRRLMWEHMVILNRYGRQMKAPDPRSPRQASAHALWSEAMSALHGPLHAKGIVESVWFARESARLSPPSLPEKTIARQPLSACVKNRSKSKPHTFSVHSAYHGNGSVIAQQSDR